MRSLIDAMYPAAGAAGVRARSHDCIAAQEDRELRVASDAEVWAWAQSQQRSVVTEDAKDFIPLAVASGGDHFGLILTHNSSFPRHSSGLFVGKLVSALDHLHLARPGDDRTGWVHWLQP